MRVARAFRLPIIAAMTALALSGCIRRAAPVAGAPSPTLDSIAYAGPAPVVVAGAPMAVPVAYVAPTLTTIRVLHARPILPRGPPALV